MFWEVKKDAESSNHIVLAVDGRPPARLLAEVACDRAERVVRMARLMASQGAAKLSEDRCGLPLAGLETADLFDLAGELFGVGCNAMADQCREVEDDDTPTVRIAE